MEEKELLFVKELTELSKKYGVYISGCGCCDSPYLTNEKQWCTEGELQWNNETDEYVWKSSVK